MLTKKNTATQAISTFSTAILLLMLTGCQPSGPKSLLLGDKYVKQGENQKALKFLARAAMLMPERPQVWNLQGLAYHGLQDPTRAADAYGRALRIDRNFAPAHFNLGVLFLEQDRLSEATAELNTYVGLQPNDDQGWSRLGAALVRARKTDEADRALTQSLKINPKNADAQNSMGLVHIQRKRPREAMQAFNTALGYRPGFSAALLNQAVVAQQHFGNSQIALERYRAFLSTRPNPKTAAAAQLAIREIEQASLETPAPVALADLTTNTGISALLRSNLAQQVERTRTNLSLQPHVQPQAPPLTASTNILTQTARINPPATVAAPPGTNVIAAIKSTPPATPSTNVAAANTPRTNPLPSNEAVEPASPVQVVAVDKEPELGAPKDNDQPLTGANSRLALNKPSSTEEPPLIAPRKKEEDRGLISKLKQANPARWFDRDEVRSEPRAVVIPPQRPPVVEERTEVAPRLAPAIRPPPIARYEYRKDLNLARGNRAQAQKIFANAAAAHQQRRLTDAIALYRQAIAADPSYFEPCYNLGLAAYQSKDLPLALSANEQAVALKPTSADARYNFALTLREGRYFVDAANELRQLLSDAPNEPRVHLALANLYSQNLDEPALARTHYTRFLQLAPNHPDAGAVRQWLVTAH